MVLIGSDKKWGLVLIGFYLFMQLTRAGFSFMIAV